MPSKLIYLALDSHYNKSDYCWIIYSTNQALSSICQLLLYIHQRYCIPNNSFLLQNPRDSIVLFFADNVFSCCDIFPIFQPIDLCNPVVAIQISALCILFKNLFLACVCPCHSQIRTHFRTNGLSCNPPIKLSGYFCFNVIIMFIRILLMAILQSPLHKRAKK